MGLWEAFIKAEEKKQEKVFSSTRLPVKKLDPWTPRRNGFLVGLSALDYAFRSLPPRFCVPDPLA